MSEQQGPGRRLGEDDERRGAEMFAAGKSEREVAEAIGCSASTAHRLRERLQGAAEGTGDGGPIGEAVDAAMRGELLAQLGGRRGELAANLADLEARAQASRDAITALDGERLSLIAAGKDAAPLRGRRRDAEDDLGDWETAAGMARQQLAALDARIAGVRAEQDLAEARQQLAAAVAERDAECARTGDRMRAAVLAVRAAAEEFVAALADERNATGRAERLEQAVADGARALGQPGPAVQPPAGTGLWVDPSLVGGQPVGLMRALSAARNGNAEQVAAHLAEAFGWLPPTAEEIAAETERMLAWRAEQERQMRPAHAGQQLVPQAQRQDWWPGAVSLDQSGNPLEPPR